MATIPAYFDMVNVVSDSFWFYNILIIVLFMRNTPSSLPPSKSIRIPPSLH